MSKTMLLTPRLSEKSYGLAQAKAVYVMDVPAAANKQSISAAVAAQFEVGVTNVRTTNIKGKAKRTIRSKGRQVERGRSSDFKKAYVTLKEGDSLPFFAAVEEAEVKSEKTQEVAAKAIEKQTAKELKQASKPAGRGGLHLPGRRSSARGGDK